MRFLKNILHLPAYFLELIRLLIELFTRPVQWLYNNTYIPFAIFFKLKKRQQDQGEGFRINIASILTAAGLTGWLVYSYRIFTGLQQTTIGNINLAIVSVLLLFLASRMIVGKYRLETNGICEKDNPLLRTNWIFTDGGILMITALSFPFYAALTLYMWTTLWPDYITNRPAGLWELFGHISSDIIKNFVPLINKGLEMAGAGYKINFAPDKTIFTPAFAWLPQLFSVSIFSFIAIALNSHRKENKNIMLAFNNLKDPKSNWTKDEIAHLINDLQFTPPKYKPLFLEVALNKHSKYPEHIQLRFITLCQKQGIVSFGIDFLFSLHHYNEKVRKAGLEAIKDMLKTKPHMFKTYGNKFGLLKNINRQYFKMKKKNPFYSFEQRSLMKTIMYLM